MAKENDPSVDQTYTPAEEPNGMREAAKTATEAVKRETRAVAAAAAEHPHTVTSLGVLWGALAFTIGYVLGRNSVDTRRRHWW
ncbi:hypothetical protein [Ensifer sp. YR511]|uniref:hypothetical protein n=1 Tax=Ensifer sp. YR511 TaxID=1855294 RepID=UPI0008921A74|nr:hypothetical protein [Ensifer sp. YR511]SDN83987.1 hypothetical protein SAMN05216328_13911 [Ensifer sp. YR511]